MSKRYTPQEKTAAMNLLQSNGGDIPATSQHSGIPQRTLYAWRRELWEQQLQQLQQTSPPLSPPQQALDIPHDITDQAAFAVVRQNILNQIRAIAPTLTTGLELVPPYQRILAVTQLLENLKRLDAYVPQQQQEYSLRVEYVDPRDGTVSNVPFWERDGDNE